MTPETRARLLAEIEARMRARIAAFAGKPLCEWPEEVRAEAEMDHCRRYVLGHWDEPQEQEQLRDEQRKLWAEARKLRAAELADVRRGTPFVLTGSRAPGRRDCVFEITRTRLGTVWYRELLGRPKRGKPMLRGERTRHMTAKQWLRDARVYRKPRSLVIRGNRDRKRRERRGSPS